MDWYAPRWLKKTTEEDKGRKTKKEKNFMDLKPSEIDQYIKE